MNIIKKFFSIIFTLIASTLIAIWNIFVFLIDLIDGGEESPEEPEISKPWYNHRTAEFDSYRKPGGLYNDNL